MDINSFLQLWRKLSREGLPQGVLVSGPTPIVQGQGREALLEVMVGPHGTDLRSEHHIRLQPEEDRVSVRVEAIRELQHFLALTRDAAQPFFVVIPQASEISMAGWNTLLKVLEEPPPQIHFIIFAKQQRQVPMTVRSRLLPFFVTPMQRTEVSDQVPQAIPLTLAALSKYLDQKPTRVEDWDSFLSGLRVTQQKYVQQGQWDTAVRLSGALIEISDILGQKRGDGSINLKYHISAVVARYAS